jgi:hypothetical protein
MRLPSGMMAKRKEPVQAYPADRGYLTIVLPYFTL